MGGDALGDGDGVGDGDAVVVGEGETVTALDAVGEGVLLLVGTLDAEVEGEAPVDMLAVLLAVLLGGALLDGDGDGVPEAMGDPEPLTDGTAEGLVDAEAGAEWLGVGLVVREAKLVGLPVGWGDTPAPVLPPPRRPALPAAAPPAATAEEEADESSPVVRTTAAAVPPTASSAATAIMPAVKRVHEQQPKWHWAGAGDVPNACFPSDSCASSARSPLLVIGLS